MNRTAKGLFIGDVVVVDDDDAVAVAVVVLMSLLQRFC